MLNFSISSLKLLIGSYLREIGLCLISFVWNPQIPAVADFGATVHWHGCVRLSLGGHSDRWHQASCSLPIAPIRRREGGMRPGCVAVPSEYLVVGISKLSHLQRCLASLSAFQKGLLFFSPLLWLVRVFKLIGFWSHLKCPKSSAKPRIWENGLFVQAGFAVQHQPRKVIWPSHGCTRVSQLLDILGWAIHRCNCSFKHL